MVVKKIPMRTCVVTREQFPKMELIRVIRTPEGEVTIDTKGKANGRGAYLKKDKKVFEQANAYGHTPYRECAFLITHGILHLLGYDHIEKEDEVVMFKLQDEILDKLNITR